MNLFRKISFINIFLFLIISHVLSKTAQKISKDGRCGEKEGICRDGYCCSKLGWCGDSDLHCEAENGCQFEFGLCKGKASKDKNIEVSMNGRCGDGLPSCRKGYCCSKWGWCGKTEYHCNREYGCQSDFGFCKDTSISSISGSNEDFKDTSTSSISGSNENFNKEKNITPSYKTCTPSGRPNGVCVKKSDCVLKKGQKGNVETVKGYCLSDPDDVLCCIKTVDEIDGEKLTKPGLCMNQSECASLGNTFMIENQCPGNSDIQLCVPTIKVSTIPPEKEIQQESFNGCPNKKIVLDISKHQIICKNPPDYDKKFIKDNNTKCKEWENDDFNALTKMFKAILIRIGDYQGDNAKNVIDSAWERIYENVKGKTNIGYYFLTRARSESRIKKHLEDVYKKIKNKQNNLPLYIDMESSNYMEDFPECPWYKLFCDPKEEKKKQNTKIVLAGIKKLKELNLRPGFYTNYDFYNNWVNSEEIIRTGASIWIARYNDGEPNRPYDLWQYASDKTETLSKIDKSIISTGIVDKNCLNNDEIIKKN